MTVATQLQQTLAALKGAQATLALYAEHSRPAVERVVYRQARQTVAAVVGDLEARQRELEFQEPQYQSP